MRIRLLMVLLFVAIAGAAQTLGPESGKLMIVGGGPANPLIEKFVELAGGEKANIVVIPTAGTQEEFGENWYFKNIVDALGVNSFTVLHTRDPKVADTREFTAPIRQATGIWFTGGRQWRLVDAYRNTMVLEECRKLLERDGIIGGSSAGATIQGSYLARGDSRGNTLMMGDHEEGFGFVTNIAIDQHLLARNRQFDMFEILEAKPELLGIGLDESTAILVEGDNFEVIGKSYVAVYDGKFWRRDSNPLVPAGNTFFLLKEGDRYNMRDRKVME